MTDQAVDADGATAAGATVGPLHGASSSAAQRELKELRADIERAGLDTLAGRKAPRARVLLIAGRPGSGRTALAEELARQVADALPGRGAARPARPNPTARPCPTERTARDLLDRPGARPRRPAPTRTS